MSCPDLLPRWTKQLAEDEAVWAAYEFRRSMPELVGKIGPLAEPASEAAARLDWLDAEQEVGRTVEAHGHWSETPR
jgi:hypothetical protein